MSVGTRLALITIFLTLSCASLALVFITLFNVTSRDNYVPPPAPPNPAESVYCQYHPQVTWGYCTP